MRRSPSSRLFPRSPRHVLRTPCQIVRLRDFRLIADRVENFSAGGLLVSPAEPVLTGEEVLISLRFPQTDEWFDATAVVSRVVHGRRPGEWSRRLGLEFHELDLEGKCLIERQLRLTPPAPPRGRPGRRETFSGWALARLSARTLGHVTAS
jgi:hypothetical protein